MLFNFLEFGIILEANLCDDFIAFYKFVLPKSCVAGVVPVVAQHEVTIFGNNVRSIISCRNFCGDKRVVKRSLASVDVYFSVSDFNSFTRQTDDTFNVVFFLIIREFENNYVKSLRVGEFLSQL